MPFPSRTLIQLTGHFDNAMHSFPEKLAYFLQDILKKEISSELPLAENHRCHEHCIKLNAYFSVYVYIQWFLVFRGSFLHVAL